MNLKTKNKLKEKLWLRGWNLAALGIVVALVYFVYEKVSVNPTIGCFVAASIYALIILFLLILWYSLGLYALRKSGKI